MGADSAQPDCVRPARTTLSSKPTQKRAPAPISGRWFYQPDVASTLATRQRTMKGRGWREAPSQRSTARSCDFSLDPLHGSRGRRHRRSSFGEHAGLPHVPDARNTEQEAGNLGPGRCVAWLRLRRCCQRDRIGSPSWHPAGRHGRANGVQRPGRPSRNCSWIGRDGPDVDLCPRAAELHPARLAFDVGNRIRRAEPAIRAQWQRSEGTQPALSSRRSLGCAGRRRCHAGDHALRKSSVILQPLALARLRSGVAHARRQPLARFLREGRAGAREQGGRDRQGRRDTGHAAVS